MPKGENNKISRQICKGLSVSRGLDGHWINFESKGKHACINVENKFKGDIMYQAIMNWITEVLEDSPGQRTERVDDEKLMPCPFCGGEVTLRDEADCWSFTCPEGTDCRHNSAIYLAGHPSREDAIKWWNTRAANSVQRIVGCCSISVPQNFGIL